MMSAFRSFGARLRRLWQFVLLFAVLRIGAGVVILAFAGRDDTAWGLRATALVLLAAVVCFAVALAVRRWAPPRQAGDAS